MLGLLLSGLLSVGNAQDPANGWLGYALGENPDGGDDPITFIEATWVNLKEPTNKNCFYSPWYVIKRCEYLHPSSLLCLIYTIEQLNQCKCIII